MANRSGAPGHSSRFVKTQTPAGAPDKTIGRGQVINDWKARPEHNANHWFEELIA
jgi:hypothetical protein